MRGSRPSWTRKARRSRCSPAKRRTESAGGVEKSELGLSGWVEAHLASRDAARVLYGAIVGLALVAALQDHPPTAGVAAGTVIAAAVAVGGAELYAEAVLVEARTRHPVGRTGLTKLAYEAAWVVFGAGFPAVYFVLAALGVMHTHTAIVLSRWTGLALILTYGYLAARLAGFERGRSAIRAAAVGLIGGALILLKAFVH